MFFIQLIIVSLISFFVTAARNHVNRMCLAADVPLIESGSAGYLGQVTVIKKVSMSLNCKDLYLALEMHPCILDK